jgi:hypothetical protein
VRPEEATVARQQCSKDVSTAMNKHATREFCVFDAVCEKAI